MPHIFITLFFLTRTPVFAAAYPVVDTGQRSCYGDGAGVDAPEPNDEYVGQDAQYEGLQPAYRDNNNGTISDLNTGLMWVKSRGKKLTWEEATRGARDCHAGGHSDWRMPTIKELYSLIDFNGRQGQSAGTSVPYIDTNYFGFSYGDVSSGERLIDCQDWSATRYVSVTMDHDAAIFGVNFADGRIKGYPEVQPGPQGGAKRLYVRYVRGNPSYGRNDLKDNKDGTIRDAATGLVWDKTDSGKGMDWKAALAWAAKKNNAEYLGHADWRLPNAKELQSIVDYTRAPATTGSAAIDPLFSCTAITNEGGARDYPFYWTSTTHLDNMGGVYIAFGRAGGWMQRPPGSGEYTFLDVHGAGAQRAAIPKAAIPPPIRTAKGRRAMLYASITSSAWYAAARRKRQSARAEPTQHASAQKQGQQREKAATMREGGRRSRPWMPARDTARGIA